MELFRLKRGVRLNIVRVAQGEGDIFQPSFDILYLYSCVLSLAFSGKSSDKALVIISVDNFPNLITEQRVGSRQIKTSPYCEHCILLSLVLSLLSLRQKCQ